MQLQEKCIYYDKKQGYYYLVLHIVDMIYGRICDTVDSELANSDGLKIKIDNIIIKNWICNYELDDNLDDFVFVKELTNTEFDSIQFLMEMDYNYPSCTIDISDAKCVTNIVNDLKHQFDKIDEIKKKIYILSKELIDTMGNL